MKRAVIFPGLGYHQDKPLLYYARRLAAEAGYEVQAVSYPEKISKDGLRGNDSAISKAIQDTLAAVRDQLDKEELMKADKVILIGKSIGTIFAAALSSQWQLPARHVLFTPLSQTFSFTGENSGIVFHGTADPWAETERIKAECERLRLPLYLTEGANHSLETGDACKDLHILQSTMHVVKEYMAE